MAKSDQSSKKNTEIYSETQATQKFCQVKLGEIKMDTASFLNRKEKYDDLKNKDFKIFLDQIRRDGRVQVPVEVVRDASGKFWILIRGHRRVAACHHLVKQNQPGFTTDMFLDAYAIEGATKEDLICRGVSDNQNRLNLIRDERIAVAYRMVQQGVPVPRAANALGVSVQTFDRDLRIAENGWMFRHFQAGDIRATEASELLQLAIDNDKKQPLADGKNRLDILREDFSAWVDAQRLIIEEADERQQARGKKAMQSSQKLVHKKLKKPLLDSWKKLLKDGQRLPMQVKAPERDYVVTQEQTTINIPPATIDLKNDSREKLARFATAFAAVPDAIIPALLIRKDEKKITAEMDISKGLELLRKNGLDDLAQKLEDDQQQKDAEAKARRDAAKNDGEPAPSTELPKPSEVDIADEIADDDEDALDDDERHDDDDDDLPDDDDGDDV